MRTERVKVWEDAGATTCAHDAAVREKRGAYEFVNCGCGFHQTWEEATIEEPYDAALSPHGVWEKYVVVKGALLMSPLAVEALLTLAGNDPKRASTTASVMLEEALRARVLDKFVEKEGTE